MCSTVVNKPLPYWSGLVGWWSKSNDGCLIAMSSVMMSRLMLNGMWGFEPVVTLCTRIHIVTHTHTHCHTHTHNIVMRTHIPLKDGGLDGSVPLWWPYLLVCYPWAPISLVYLSGVLGSGVRQTKPLLCGQVAAHFLVCVECWYGEVWE